MYNVKFKYYGELLAEINSGAWHPQERDSIQLGDITYRIDKITYILPQGENGTINIIADVYRESY